MTARRNVASVLRVLADSMPLGAAEDWDNVGLLAGDPEWKTPGALVSIDLTRNAVETASKRGFRLVVCHHPCFFPSGRGISRLTPPHPALEALRKGIAVAAFHTNYDRVALAPLLELARALRSKPVGRLERVGARSLRKLVVFVPRTHRDRVREAVCAAGAGVIGAYDQCSFSAPGTGTFRGSPDSRPFLGEPGRLENANEDRLETLFPAGMEDRVLKALRASHPYEEIAYDLIALEQEPGLGLVPGLGYGIIGECKIHLGTLVSLVRKHFGLRAIRMTGASAGRLVRRWAFAPGSAGSLIESALSRKCDLFITGEASYHEATDGLRRGLTTMELGHAQSEIFFLKHLDSVLESAGIRSAIHREFFQEVSK